MCSCVSPGSTDCPWGRSRRPSAWTPSKRRWPKGSGPDSSDAIPMACSRSWNPTGRLCGAGVSARGSIPRTAWPAIASLIAARRLETSPEVQGALPKATLLPIVVAAAEPGPRWRTPRGNANTVLLALRAAADLGAKVVNVSLGVPVDRSELASLAGDPVWDRLERDGVIVVCAAGNDGRDLDREPIFPASIDRPNVIAVAAHGPDGILMGHHVPAGESSGPRSGFGVRRVECSAPGEALVVATTRGRSELVEGTSYAAALVSAAVAAAMAIEPDAKPERLLELVTGSARIDALEGLVARGAVRLPSD
ncbi:MAG: S8 family serine peptidase [Phycisphaerales bacterium]